MLDLRIKQATSQELPTIRELAQEIWREYYPPIISMPQIEYMLERGYSLAALAAFAEHQEAGFLLAIGDEIPVGFAGYHTAEVRQEVELDKLYVLATHRRSGVGRALMGEVTRIACKAGFATLILNVNKHNTGAIKAYEQNGFTIREAIVNDIGQGFVMDDYVMEKPIGR